MKSETGKKSFDVMKWPCRDRHYRYPQERYRISSGTASRWWSPSSKPPFGRNPGVPGGRARTRSLVMKWLRWDAGRIVYVDCREGDGG